MQIGIQTKDGSEYGFVYEMLDFLQRILAMMQRLFAGLDINTGKLLPKAEDTETEDEEAGE